MTAKGLGQKTFLLLFLKRSSVGIIFLLGAILAGVGPNLTEGSLGSLLFTAGLWAMLLGVLLIAGALGLTWLEYSHYNVVTGENDVKTTMGILTEEETGIPYRRIREVKVNRSITDQFFGVSTLIITVTAEEGDRESEIYLPALDVNLAKQLQETILKRAGVEEMDVSPKTS
jgi:membrane protein YdbS with pleckstrin-like domain